MRLLAKLSRSNGPTRALASDSGQGVLIGPVSAISRYLCHVAANVASIRYFEGSEFIKTLVCYSNSITNREYTAVVPLIVSS